MEGVYFAQVPFESATDAGVAVGEGWDSGGEVGNGGVA